MTRTTRITLSLFAVLASSPAYAAFKCGPGFATYSVVSTAGATGAGVRCVKFNGYEVVNGGIAGAYWYGEGRWGTTTYRHIGHSFKTPLDLNGNYTSRAQAADIYGNGEGAGGHAENLTLVPINGANRIRVTGDWAEEWIRQGTGIQSGYTSTLAAVTRCGGNLTSYTVSDGAGSFANGTGVRCGLRSAYLAYPSVWYGEGNWGATRYQHLGFWSGTSASDPAAAQATGSDICNNAGFFCGATALSGLNLKLQTGCFQPMKIRVTGNWNENWSSDTRLECIR